MDRTITIKAKTPPSSELENKKGIILNFDKTILIITRFMLISPPKETADINSGISFKEDFKEA